MNLDLNQIRTKFKPLLVYILYSRVHGLFSRQMVGEFKNRKHFLLILALNETNCSKREMDLPK